MDPENGPGQVSVGTLQKLKHDLKNPLSIISGNTQLIRAIVADSPEARSITDSIDDIEAACEQMQTIIDSLSDVD